MVFKILETLITFSEYLRKKFSDKGIEVCSLTMEKYIELIENYEADSLNSPSPPYCHDLPLFSLIPSLIEDAQPFPLDYLPKWYWHKWWRYCQFFLGCSNSITPLHFDCLLTNNIFFSNCWTQTIYHTTT